MNFGEAFEQVKKGKGMRLPHRKPDVVIRACHPDENSEMTAPFGKVPWKETMTVKEAKEELATDLAWLWEEYVLASPEDLSQDAKELAERLRIVFERHGLSV